MRHRRDEGSVYAAIKAAGIPTGHHESDLYVLDTPEARRILQQHGRSYSRFVSATDRRFWLDVPFAYAPWWQKKAQAGRLHRPGLAKAALRDRDPKRHHAWVLRSVGEGGEEGQHVAAFKDKGEAQRRMRLLQASQRRAGMRPYRYTIQHRPVPSRATFGSRTARRELDKRLAGRDPKRPTFAAARANLLEYLKTHGWDVKTWGPSGALKTPHATSPSGRLRLWFKPQAVYYTSGTHHEMGNARSLWIDIRDHTPAEVAAASSRWEPSGHDPSKRDRGWFEHPRLHKWAAERGLEHKKRKKRRERRHERRVTRRKGDS